MLKKSDRLPIYHGSISLIAYFFKSAHDYFLAQQQLFNKDPSLLCLLIL